MAAATSSRKKRTASSTTITTAKQKGRKKIVKAASSGKAFLNGNHYARLSGMYLTSLDYMDALSEWNSIPWLQSLYGAPLIGYSKNPLALSSDDGFIGKDAPQGALEPNEVYFPIYERKKHDTSSWDAKEKLLSSAISDLAYLEKEQLKVGIGVDGRSVSFDSLDGRPGPLLVKTDPTGLGDGDPESYGDVFLASLTVDDGDEILVKSGSFYLSAMFSNGGATPLSSFLYLDDPSGFSVPSDDIVKWIQVLPRDPRGDASRLDYKEFFATNWTWNDEISANTSDARLSCYKAYAKYIGSNVIDGKMALARSGKGGKYRSSSTAMFYKSQDADLRYQLENGFYVPDNISIRWDKSSSSYIPVSPEIVALDTDQKLSAYLEANAGLPNMYMSKIETTLVPNKTGWYRFAFSVDDFLAIAIDDKLVGMGYLQNAPYTDDGTPPYPSWFENEFDEFHPTNFNNYTDLTSNGWDQGGRHIHELTATSLSNNTIAGISANVLSGDYNFRVVVDNKKFFDDYVYNTPRGSSFISAHHPQMCEVYSGQGAAPNGKLKRMIVYYPHMTSYFSLSAGNKYKFTAWYIDSTFSAQYNINVQTMLKTYCHYHSDSEFDSDPSKYVDLSVLAGGYSEMTSIRDGFYSQNSANYLTYEEFISCNNDIAGSTYAGMGSRTNVSLPISGVQLLSSSYISSRVDSFKDYVYFGRDKALMNKNIMAGSYILQPFYLGRYDDMLDAVSSVGYDNNYSCLYNGLPYGTYYRLDFLATPTCIKGPVEFH